MNIKNFLDQHKKVSKKTLFSKKGFQKSIQKSIQNFLDPHKKYPKKFFFHQTNHLIFHLPPMSSSNFSHFLFRDSEFASHFFTKHPNPYIPRRLFFTPLFFKINSSYFFPFPSFFPFSCFEKNK